MPTSANALFEDVAPFNDAAAGVGSDSAVLSPVARGIYCGVAGDIAIQTNAGTNVTFKAVPAGTVLNILVKRFMATGTTATNCTLLY